MSDSCFDMLTKVALVVPTYNRPSFVHRTLSYHARSTGLQIIFGDGSDPENLAENKRIIRMFSDSGIEVIHYTPTLPEYVKVGLEGPYGLIERMVNSGRQSTRPFINICGDDDFVSPEFLADAATYLTEHEDFVATIGYHLSFHLDAPGAVGRIAKSALSFSPRTRAESSAATRIARYEIHGENALDFAFFRRNAYETFGGYLLRLAHVAQDPADPTPARVTAFTALYLQNLISDHVCLALGKVLWLPRLQLGRHFHDGNYGGYVRTVLRANLGDSIVASQWPAMAAVYLDAITDTLMQAEGLDRGAARRIAEGALAMRVGYRLGYVGRQRLSESGVSLAHMVSDATVRSTLRRVPGLRWLAGVFRRAISGAKRLLLKPIPEDGRALRLFLDSYQ